MSNLAVTNRRRSENGDDESSRRDHEHLQMRRPRLQYPLYPQPEEDRISYAPWRLFEERVRTGPYGLTRFPLRPHSPMRILILSPGSEGWVNPRLRQFIGDSPPRVRYDWHLDLQSEPEDPGLTDEEFKKAMKKLKKQVYNPPYPRRRAWRRGLFSSWTSGGSPAKEADDMDKEDGKECTICLEAFVPNEQVLVTPCNHMFHNECLVPWVKSHGQCPVCRFVLCERRQTAIVRSNNGNGNGNGRDVNVYNNVEDLGDYDDLVSLIRAMEEAFNWVASSRVMLHP